MFHTTQALVLREVRYKEADRILTLFSASDGKITAKARGALRIIDLYFVLDKLLSSFGNVNKDVLKYNIINDNNCMFPHNGGVKDELFEIVHSELIKKGII